MHLQPSQRRTGINLSLIDAGPWLTIILVLRRNATHSPADKLLEGCLLHQTQIKTIEWMKDFTQKGSINFSKGVRSSNGLKCVTKINKEAGQWLRGNPPEDYSVYVLVKFIERMEESSLSETKNYGLSLADQNQETTYPREDSIRIVLPTQYRSTSGNPLANCIAQSRCNCRS